MGASWIFEMNSEATTEPGVRWLVQSRSVRFGISDMRFSCVLLSLGVDAHMNSVFLPSPADQVVVYVK